MKRLLLFTLAVVCCAGLAHAQAGDIAAVTDAAGTSCLITDGGSLVAVYFVHTGHPGATASQWKLDLNGIGWTHLGDQINFPTVIGTTVGGISIGYGNCLDPPVAIGFANFFGSSAAACSAIRIRPDPASLSGEIEAVDCGTPAVKVFPRGVGAWVNSDGSCDCTSPPLPVDNATWGQIKALYN